MKSLCAGILCGAGIAAFAILITYMLPHAIIVEQATIDRSTLSACAEQENEGHCRFVLLRRCDNPDFFYSNSQRCLDAVFKKPKRSVPRG